MKGLVFDGEKAAIRDDVEVRSPGPAEVKVRIVAAGLCHSDLSVIDGTIPWNAPTVLGHEGAGIVAEVGSAWVRRLLAHPAQYVIYTTVLAQAEVISALQRRVREGRLERVQAQRLAQRVTVHFAQRYQVITITQAIVDQACGVLQAYPLRAADAIHLACALTIRRIAQEQALPPPSFVVADTALLTAATAEGFVVENPLQHP